MMKVYDLILKKRSGGELSREEIAYLIEGYTAGAVPDSQLAAFAMAVYFQGMSAEETLHLTRAMANSGDTISLKEIPGVIVDKHSTGGVGDTTTLVLAPLVASAGLPVAKMSGRGLGHTGGTIDKLEAIPGFQTALSIDEMIAAVRRIGIAVVGQTENLVPADKKLYALRDLTATVESLPLIAASIMSKKLAAGAGALLLDVKMGGGAFIKDYEEALTLAETMVEIGRGAGRETAALLTSMEQPLGCAVGNALEVKEAILTLRDKGPADLTRLCLDLGGWMLFLAGEAGSPREGRQILQSKLTDGAALDKFKAMIRSQQGNAAVIDDLSLLPQAKAAVEVIAAGGGYVQELKAEAVGRAAMTLGAGRKSEGAPIDLAAGVTLLKKISDPVKPGDALARLHHNCAAEDPAVAAARKLILEAYRLGPVPAAAPKLILGYVDRAGRHNL